MATAEEFDAVWKLVDEGRLSPVIDHVFPWAERQDAWTRFEDPALFGKVVIDLRDYP
jgi:NADPH:quinone reductase-like Zn-dependent oxidoreductase